MNTMLRRARAAWPGNRNYQRQWVRSLRFLGPRWLLAKRE